MKQPLLPLFLLAYLFVCLPVPVSGDAPASDSKAKNLFPAAPPVDGSSEEAFDSPHEAYRRDHEVKPYYLRDVRRITSGGTTTFREETGVVWNSDIHFIGGATDSTTDSIANTHLDPIYQTERRGDFSYEIPVPEEGFYTVELHFAEIQWDSEDSRIFDIAIENDQFLENIDLFKDYGGKNYASKITVEDIHVVDGHLSLEFITKKDQAKVSGIAVFQQVLPDFFRINAGNPRQLSLTPTDIWFADQHFHGGKVYETTSQITSGPGRNGVYDTERFGYDFSYRLPVAREGLYTVELHFAEIYWDKEGERIFNVDIENGQFTEENIDLIKYLGVANKAGVIIAENIEVTDGVLDIRFRRLVNNAKISGITVFNQEFHPDAPIIADIEDVVLDVGQPWVFQVAGKRQNSSSPLSYRVEGLPDGISMLPNGLISGTSFFEGTRTILIRTEDNGLVSSTTFQLTIRPLLEIARINSGGGSIQFGEEHWQGDQYFTDGRTYSNDLSIFNTQNDLLYQSERNGDFSYEIPVPKAGYYTVELHFAEIFWDRAGGPVRQFDVSVENQQFTQRIQTQGQGNSLLGYRYAHVIELKDIKVVDGFLTVDLTTIRDRAKISGIAVFKQGHPYVLPAIRVNAGGLAFMHMDEQWIADRYYTGGTVFSSNTRDRLIDIENTTRDRLLYHTERFGNFSYNLPVPEQGLYTVELHFAEIWWDEEGRRVFNVEVENEQFKLENIDLYKDHGGKYSASVFIAENIQVNDGTLDIEFRSKVNNAKVSGVVIRKQDDLKPDMNASARLLAEPESAEEPSLDVRFGEAKLYPNPTSDRVRLDFDTDQHASWSFVLVSPNGQTLFLDKIDLETGSHSVDFDLSVHRLSSGIYFLQVSDGKGNVKVMRLIKH